MRLAEADIITPTLLKRFHDEARFEDADGRFCALILCDNGTDLIRHAPGSPDASPEQLLWAGDMLRLLNRELHHDGAWVVVFTHVQPAPVECVLHNLRASLYGRYALIWIDQDADPQFSVEWEAGTGELRDFADVMLAGRTSTVQKCETAWGIAQTARQALDLRPTEQFRRARGERAPSARH
jgi:hypothetical protein